MDKLRVSPVRAEKTRESGSLNQMGPIPQGHHTMSFDCLMQAVDMVRNDSDELFLTIERDNPFAADVRRTFFRHAADLNRHLETAC